MWQSLSSRNGDGRHDRAGIPERVGGMFVVRFEDSGTDPRGERMDAIQGGDLVAPAVHEDGSGAQPCQGNRDRPAEDDVAQRAVEGLPGVEHRTAHQVRRRPSSSSCPGDRPERSPGLRGPEPPRTTGRPGKPARPEDGEPGPRPSLRPERPRPPGRPGRLKAVFSNRSKTYPAQHGGISETGGHFLFMGRFPFS